MWAINPFLLKVIFEILAGKCIDQATDPNLSALNTEEVAQTVYGSPEQIQLKLRESKNFEHCYVNNGGIYLKFRLMKLMSLMFFLVSNQ